MKKYLVLILLLFIAPPATMRERERDRRPVFVLINEPEPWFEDGEWRPETAVRPDSKSLDLRTFEVDGTTVSVKIRPDGANVKGTWKY